MSITEAYRWIWILFSFPISYQHNNDKRIREKDRLVLLGWLWIRRAILNGSMKKFFFYKFLILLDQVGCWSSSQNIRGFKTTIFGTITYSFIRQIGKVFVLSLTITEITFECIQFVSWFQHTSIQALGNSFSDKNVTATHPLSPVFSPGYSLDKIDNQ